MHSDDEPVGRILSRRQALALMGIAGAGLAVAGGAGAAQAATRTDAGVSAGAVDCVAKPEQVEGPYFVDEGLNRSDIRIDTSDGSVVAGTRLSLNLSIVSVTGGSCTALPGAKVDIWHCDATGIYSDEAANDSVGHNFLRGYQITDRAGRARFTTILPGWYTGRTIHLHVKVRTTGTDGNPYEFTSQLYFPSAFDTAFLATDPYAASGTPDTTNDTDFIYADGGDQMTLSPRKQGKGWTADFCIGFDLSDTSVGAGDGNTNPPIPAPSESPSA